MPTDKAKLSILPDYSRFFNTDRGDNSYNQLDQYRPWIDYNTKPLTVDWNTPLQLELRYGHNPDISSLRKSLFEKDPDIGRAFDDRYLKSFQEQLKSHPKFQNNYDQLQKAHKDWNDNRYSDDNDLSLYSSDEAVAWKKNPQFHEYIQKQKPLFDIENEVSKKIIDKYKSESSKPDIPKTPSTDISPSSSSSSSTTPNIDYPQPQPNTLLQDFGDWIRSNPQHKIGPWLSEKHKAFQDGPGSWISKNPIPSAAIALGTLGAGYGAYKYLTRNKKKPLQKVSTEMDVQLDKKAWQNHYVDEYWKDVFPKLIATGAIGGGVLRGGIGLLELLKHNMRPGPEPVEPTVLDIPYRPVPQGQSDVKKKPLLSFQKTSANWGWGSTFLGAGAKNLWEVPIAYPASIAGVAGGGILGYKLIDHLVKKQKRKMVDEELDDAKDQYHKAMMLQFDPLSGNKVKSIKAAELSEKSNIDKCLDESTDIGKDLTKLATGVIDAAEGAGRMGLGAYTALASLLALGTGYATHKYMEPPYHQSELIRKQIDDRASNPLQPSDTFARLVPVDERNRPIDMNKKKNQLLYGPTEGATPLNKESLDLRVNKFVKQLVGRK